MKELFIIRHARTVHNLGDSPSLDSPITDFGEKQSKLLGRFFKEQKLLTEGFRFITSPFLRCLQTASFMLEGAGEEKQEFVRHCDMSELSPPSRVRFHVQSLAHEYLGHYHFKDKRSLHIQNRKDLFSDMEWMSYPTLGMDFIHETNEEFMHRIRSLYYRLPDKAVVITHGLPAMALMHVASDPTFRYMPVWDWCLDNASITWVKNGRIIWRGLNLFWEDEGWAYGLTRERYDEDVIPVHERTNCVTVW